MVRSYLLVEEGARNPEWCGIEESKSALGLAEYAHVPALNGAFNPCETLSPPYLDVDESVNNFFIMYKIGAFIAHSQGCHEAYLELATLGQNIERHVMLLLLIKPSVQLF